MACLEMGGGWGEGWSGGGVVPPFSILLSPFIYSLLCPSHQRCLGTDQSRENIQRGQGCQTDPFALKPSSSASVKG